MTTLQDGHGQDGQGRVGIVLVNFNGLKFMPECLSSLHRIDYSPARIVVVDNASSDGSREWLEENYPDLPVLALPENVGVTGGNNAGIRWCLDNRCDWVLLLNNDTVVDLDFLSELMRHAEPNTLAVPKIYFYDNRLLLNSNVGAFDYRRGLNIQWFYGRPDSPASAEVRDATMSSTCAMLIPCGVFAQIGTMDETYFMYYDDTDFVTRAVRAGCVVRFVPSAVIYHKESSTSGGGGSPLSIYYLNRNRLYFMFKHQKSRPALAFFLLYFSVTRLRDIIKYLGRRQGRQLSALKNGILDFCRGQMGRSPRSLTR